SMAAAVRDMHGPLTRAQLADVEHYAVTEYLVDLARGEHDPAAIVRRTARVAEFTGLPPDVVSQAHGQIDNDVFLHELKRAEGRISSVYDATISTVDPDPLTTMNPHADPLLEGLRAPVSSAMVTIYRTQLNWRPEFTYELWNPAVSR